MDPAIGTAGATSDQGIEEAGSIQGLGSRELLKVSRVQRIVTAGGFQGQSNRNSWGIKEPGMRKNLGHP